METSVWTQAPIRKRITEDYVLVSLYVDDRTPLPQPIDVAGGKRLRTVGDLWLYTQERLLRTNAQPYYVLTDADLRLLAPAIGYTPDLDAYEAFLRQGTEQFGG
jgi:thiol:disulfide interchange protein DsbD